MLVDPEPGEAYLVDGHLPVGSVALAERVTHEEFAARHRAVRVPGCMFGGGHGSGRHGALAALGIRALMSVRGRMAAGAAAAVVVVVIRPGRHCRLRGKRIAYIPQEPMSNLDPAYSIGSQLTA